MPFSVLKLLSSESFRSGEELASCLGLSRASVHNLVARARAQGIEIHAVRGRGYRLAEPGSWLDQACVEAAARRGFQMLLRQEVDSTNSQLLALAQVGQAHRSLLAAEWQSGGRGRRGRAWVSPPGGGLTFSLLWRFSRPLTALSGLSLAVGVALVRGLRRLGVTGVGLKWPNDVLVDGGKLAGILIETHGDMLSAATAVIGVGLNVRLPAVRPEAYPVAALEAILDQRIDRNELLLCLLDELEAVLSLFDVEGFAPFRAEWQACHVWQEQPVRVIGAGPDALEGIALGVDETGVLLIGTATGVRAVHSGDVSLRAGSRR
jgi:BirA family transcriptional regulator, biotin operon repressor / biotin---[acetyl-CoA-carboxylase] ligase